LFCGTTEHWAAHICGTLILPCNVFYGHAKMGWAKAHAVSITGININVPVAAVRLPLWEGLSRFFNLAFFFDNGNGFFGVALVLGFFWVIYIP
jgi:hypothetical protein